MRTYFAMLILSAVASFVLTPLVRRIAFRFGAVDFPSERKIHAVPMPRLGGVAVYAGFTLPWMTLYWLNNVVSIEFQNYERLLLALVLGATAMLVLGIYDDLRGANALKKLCAQVAVAVALYSAGFRITVLSNPFGAPFELGIGFGLPVSVLWIVGITNAINLLDGIDGLAAGVTAWIALSLAFINILAGKVMVALMTLCLAGACLGFLPYNFSPARIFLGDSGSLFLGLVLACIGMFSLFKGTTATLVLAPAVLFGLPVFDLVQVVWHRWRDGRPLMKADKTHVHHRLLELGLNQKQAAYLLYGITIFLGLLAVALNLQQSSRGALALIAAGCAIVVLVWLGWRLRARTNLAKESG